MLQLKSYPTVLVMVGIIIGLKAGGHLHTDPFWHEDVGLWLPGASLNIFLASFTNINLKKTHLLFCKSAIKHNF